MDLKEEPQGSHNDSIREESEGTSSIDPALEASIRKKLDMRLMPILTLVYLFAFIDRSNAGNARVLGRFHYFCFELSRLTCAIG